MNPKTVVFLKNWGWLIGALLIIFLLVLGNQSGCTRVQTEEPQDQDLDLYESAYQDLNSAYKKQQRAERSRQKYLNAAETFCGNQDSEALGSQGNNAGNNSNTACCDSASTTIGNGNQIVNINVGDDLSKKGESVVEARPTQTKQSSSTSTSTRTVVREKPCTTVINNYYGYEKKESRKTVKEAVQPKVSSSTSSFRKEIQTSEGMRLFEGEEGRIEYEGWLNNFSKSGGNAEDCEEVQISHKVGDFYKEAPYKGGIRVFRGEEGRIEYEEYLNGEESTKSYSSNSESSNSSFRKEVKTSEGNRVFTSESEYNAWIQKVRGGR
ncbi:MAG: hypothetical protein PHQ01_00510 [Candidatus Pacebacteria bacterium]|nr:hypothetical protein [Candidatus Paceibacterota bacterium]